SIHGTHICGDSVDIVGDTVLAGSWRPEKQLQTYDFHTTEMLKEIEWAPSDDGRREATLVYAARFGGDRNQYIAAGGSCGDEAKVFDTTTGALIGGVKLPGAIYSLDFAPSGRYVAFAGANFGIEIADLAKKMPSKATKSEA
ncbi:hypothetical protein KIPB_003636, partial [Kipferlia bialata]